MKYTFQVPIPHMDTFISDADFFFCLAHLALANRKYCDWFIERPTLLDNGVHELSVPLPLTDLLNVAEMIQPAGLIPPDFLYDTSKTIYSFHETLDRTGSRYTLWPVIQGRSWKDIDTCINEYTMQGMLQMCVPYRLGSFVRSTIAFRMPQEVSLHFLGMTNLDELRSLRFFSRGSIDTGKPFRWAQNYKVWPNGKAPDKLDMHKGFNIATAKLGIMNIKEVTEFETS